MTFAKAPSRYEQRLSKRLLVVVDILFSVESMMSSMSSEDVSNSGLGSVLFGSVFYYKKVIIVLYYCSIAMML